MTICPGFQGQILLSRVFKNFQKLSTNQSTCLWLKITTFCLTNQLSTELNFTKSHIKFQKELFPVGNNLLIASLYYET